MRVIMTIWHETARAPPRHRAACKCVNRRFAPVDSLTICAVYGGN